MSSVNKAKKQLIFYHGSNVLIPKSSDGFRYLEPRPSKVIDNESAVFATNNKDMAVIFIPFWKDNQIEFGIVNKKLYCIEQYPNAFDIFNKCGYIYEVDGPPTGASAKPTT